MRTKWHDLCDFSVGDRIIVDPILPAKSKHKGKKGIISAIGKQRLTITFDEAEYDGQYVDHHQAKKIDKFHQKRDLKQRSKNEIMQEIMQAITKLASLFEELNKIE